MTPSQSAPRAARPSLLPVGFALALAVLAIGATLTSDRLWAQDMPQPAPLTQLQD